MRTCFNKITYVDWGFGCSAILILALMVRSVFTSDEFHLQWSHTDVQLHFKFGIVAFQYVDRIPKPMPMKLDYFPNPIRSSEIDWKHLTTTWGYAIFQEPVVFDYWLLGFRSAYLRPRDGAWALWVQIPYWFIALCLGIGTARKLFRRYVRGQRQEDGRCPKCSYDLRASRDRCPECGTPTKQRQMNP